LKLGISSPNAMMQPGRTYVKIPHPIEQDKPDLED